MAKVVTLQKDQIVLRTDHQMRLALAFSEDRKRVDYIGMTSEGPQCLFMTAEAFHRQFANARGSADPNALSFIPKLLRAVKRAYLPDPEAAPILLEILKMTTIEGKDLKSCSVKELVVHMNALREAEGSAPVTEKTYKSKAKLLEAIEKAEQQAQAPTSAQCVNKKAASEAADKRLSGLVALKEQKAEEAELKRQNKAEKAQNKEAQVAKAKKSEQPPFDVEKKPAKKPAAAKAAPAPAPAAKKAAAKAAPAPAAKKAAPVAIPVKGSGIGAFCRAQIHGGLTNNEIADLARAEFGSNTTAASVAWYRNQMKQAGEI